MAIERHHVGRAQSDERVSRSIFSGTATDRSLGGNCGPLRHGHLARKRYTGSDVTNSTARVSATLARERRPAGKCAGGFDANVRYGYARRDPIFVRGGSGANSASNLASSCHTSYRRLLFIAIYHHRQI